MRTEDGYIINKCLNGEVEAFGLLVDKYKATIFALAYSKLGSFHDAEDVTQDVFVSAYEKLRTLRRHDSFFAWLYSMTANLCKMHMRAQSRRHDREYTTTQDSQSIEARSLQAHRQQQMIEAVHDALASLPEMYRQVLTLYYLCCSS